MVSKNKQVIIFKNDAVGDLTQSLNAIYNIINIHHDKKILIYLSERSENFSFLINNKNIEFKKLNYDLKFIEKIKLLFTIYKMKISDIYILTPKKYYYLLPIIFRKVKFHALCINGPNNYKRPNEYLRKFLFKYVINDRAAIFKRKHTSIIQSNLINEKFTDYKKKIKLGISDFLRKNLPEKYIYFHLKKSIADKLNWNTESFELLFNELLKYYDYVIFTRDIEKNMKQDSIYKKFNSIDFKKKSKNFIAVNTKIILFDNIEGKDLYNTIKYSSKILAFHGMMTNLGAIEEKKIIDLWFCEIKNWNDYRNYRNAFYEFKPIYEGYDFIIPKNNMDKTIKKIRYSLKKYDR